MQTDRIETIAPCTAVWSRGSPEAVASFCGETGGIVINRGTPWEGRAGVAAMAAETGMSPGRRPL